MIEQNDVGRQVLVLGAEAVGHPRADARVALPYESGVHLKQPGAVREAVGVGAADDRDVIDFACYVGIEVGDLDARLAVLLERPCRAEQSAEAAAAHREQRVGIEVRHRLAVPPVQLGLGVERIDLTDPAIHEQENAALGPGLEVGLFGRERRGGLRAAGRSARGARLRAEETVLGQKVGEGRAGESSAGLPQELTAGFAARQARRASPGLGFERYRHDSRC